MNRWLIALALSAGIAVPVAVIAQQQSQAPSMRQAPSPEMRSQMQRIFAGAKTDALGALSTDHRNRVQGIADQVSSGSLDRRAASQQIDALLTANEKSAVNAVALKSRNEMSSLRNSMNGPQGGPSADNPGGMSRRPRTPSAGRFLLMVLRSHQPGGPGPGR